MSNAAFVLIAIGVIIVVSVLLWLLNRKPQTFMSSIDDFEREMKALGGETAKGGAASRARRRTIAPSSRRPSTASGSSGASGAPGAPGAPAGSNGSTGSGATGEAASNGSDGSGVSSSSNGSGQPEGSTGSGVGRSGADPADGSGESQP